MKNKRMQESIESLTKKEAIVIYNKLEEKLKKGPFHLNFNGDWPLIPIATAYMFLSLNITSYIIAENKFKHEADNKKQIYVEEILNEHKKNPFLMNTLFYGENLSIKKQFKK